MAFLRRQVVTAALTANALRPLPGMTAGVPSFAVGWPTRELAPHLVALTAADAGLNLLRRKRSPLGLALAAGSLAGLGLVIRQGQRSRELVEGALLEGLGADYAEQLEALPTPADLATPWRQLVNPFRMHDVRVRVKRNIPYSDAGKRGMLDVWIPRDVEIANAPVLLQIHGGGWTIGEKEQQGILLMQQLAAQGWVCVAINYRLSPRDAWPAHIVDVKRAIAWIKDNIADYGGDPDYLAITGGSAGGHLAALAALTPNDPAYQPGFEDADTTVQAAVPFYGVYDLAGVLGTKASIGMRDRFLGPRIMKQKYADSPDVFEAASPLLRITGDAPDFFVIHGQHDTLVPVQQARAFVAKLTEVSKRSVVYAELPGTQHAFDVFTSIRSLHVIHAVDRFLHWHWNGHRAVQGVDVPDVTRGTTDSPAQEGTPA